MDGRHGVEENGYRYGFQGQEMDDEVKGEGNSVNYKYRMHDSRIGRFLCLDPKAFSYPFMSPYCHAGNNPIYFIDYNGEGPKPAIRSWVEGAVKKFSPAVYRAFYFSNNTSIRELEKWIYGEAGRDKGGYRKIIGAMGEALTYAFIHQQIAGINQELLTNGIQWNYNSTLLFQSRLESNDNWIPDVVQEFTVGSRGIKLTSGLNGGTYEIEKYNFYVEFTSINGEEYIEKFTEDINLANRPNNTWQYNSKTYRLQYEVKTLKKGNIMSNIKYLSKGLEQVQARLGSASSMHKLKGKEIIGVLVTDYDAYMEIYNEAQRPNGLIQAKDFINSLEEFLGDDDGRLLLIEGLRNDANSAAWGLKDRVKKAQP